MDTDGMSWADQSNLTVVYNIIIEALELTSQNVRISLTETWLDQPLAFFRRTDCVLWKWEKMNFTAVVIIVILASEQISKISDYIPDVVGLHATFAKT